MEAYLLVCVLSLHSRRWIHVSFLKYPLNWPLFSRYVLGRPFDIIISINLIFKGGRYSPLYWWFSQVWFGGNIQRKTALIIESLALNHHINVTLARSIKTVFPDMMRTYLLWWPANMTYEAWVTFGSRNIALIPVQCRLLIISLRQMLLWLSIVAWLNLFFWVNNRCSRS